MRARWRTPNIEWRLRRRQGLRFIPQQMIEITINGELRRVGSQTTVAALVAQLSLTPHQVAVEVNRQLVPRGDHAARRLQSGDQLEIVSLAGGG